MKTIIYCKECDHRYENLDGTMDCMRFECLTVEPDDFCAWGEYGEGTKEKPPTEEDIRRWEEMKNDPNYRLMASSATILTEEDIERMKEALAALPMISVTVNQKGE